MMSARRLLDWHLGCCRPCPHIASRHVTCPHGGESAKRYSSALAGNVPSVSMPPGVKVARQGQGGAGQGEWLASAAAIHAGPERNDVHGLERCAVLVLRPVVRHGSNDDSCVTATVPDPPPPTHTNTPRADCAYIPVSPVLPRENDNKCSK